MQGIGAVVTSLLIIGLLSVMGCRRDTWEVKDLKISGPPQDYRGEDLGRYPEHTIDGVVFRLSSRARESSLYTGEGPFDIWVLGFSEPGRETRIEVRGIEIVSSLEGVAHTLAGAASLPLVFQRQTGLDSQPRGAGSRSVALLSFEEALDPDFDAGETITINFGIAVGETERRLTFELKTVTHNGAVTLPNT